MLLYAYQHGINFVDTADLYGTYAHIKEALRTIPRTAYVISTKSYAYDRSTAKASLDKALDALDTPYVDLFMLHEQESAHTLRGHREALDYFLEQKQMGIIRAVGMSTHFIAAVRAAAKLQEIDVIHPIFNQKGIGIQDGSINEMRDAIRDFKARSAGGGIFAMKPLAGGHLINDLKASFDFVLDEPSLDAIAVGMQSIDEIDANISIFEREAIPDALNNRLKLQKRILMVHDWCTACGNCEKRCQLHAINVHHDPIHGSRAVVNTEKCVLCGYCSTVCPEFCLKVI